MKLGLKKVYTISKKAEKPRLFIQHLVCEEAGLLPGEDLYVHVDEESEQIILQNRPFENDDSSHTVAVSSRLNKVSNKRRPLIDTCGDRYASIISVKQRVEMSVYKGKNCSRIVICPLRYNLLENETLSSESDQRLRLLSIAAGCGVGTSALVDTGLYTASMEIELEEDCAAVLRHNFPKSYIFNGDIRHCNSSVKSDVAFISLPCVEHSNLGNGTENVSLDLAIATAKIIAAAKPDCLFFENVNKFYKTEMWHNLKTLLKDDYPFWIEKNIEAHDFGSIALRNRTYACAFTDKNIFNEFSFPTPPKVKKRKLKEFLDSSKVEHIWKSLEDWKNSFNSRKGWIDRNLDMTFVTKDVSKIANVPSRYRAGCASSSFVLSEDKKHWRFLTESELRRIFGMPQWFEFCDHTPTTRRYEMIGQSVYAPLIQAIGNRLALAIVSAKKLWRKTEEKVQQALSVDSRGQLELVI